MLVTPEGNETSARLEQSLNALYPMPVRPSGNEASARLEQFQNA
jgi:hypothetical protein